MAFNFNSNIMGTGVGSGFMKAIMGGFHQTTRKMAGKAKKLIVTGMSDPIKAIGMVGLKAAKMMGKTKFGKNIKELGKTAMALGGLHGAVLGGFLELLEKLGVFDPIIQTLSGLFELLGGLILAELMPIMTELITILLSPETIAGLQSLAIILAAILRPMLEMAVIVLPYLTAAVKYLSEQLLPIAPYFTAFGLILGGIEITVSKVSSELDILWDAFSDLIDILKDVSDAVKKIKMPSTESFLTGSGSRNLIAEGLSAIGFAGGSGLITQPTFALLGENPATSPERVFNKPQLEAIDNALAGGGSGGITIVINMNGLNYANEQELATAVARKIGLYVG